MRSPRRVVRAALLLGLAAGSRGVALDPARAVTQYGHDVWQSEQGLPYRTVLGLGQSADGYLWIGTPEALLRFDGVRFVTYGRRGSPSFPARDPRAFLVDRSGRFWVGGRRLYRLEGGSFVEALDAGQQFGHIAGLHQTRAGALLATTPTGVFEIVGRVSRPILTAREISDGVWSTMREVAEDAQGRLYIGTNDRGLAVLEHGELRFLGEAEGLPSRSTKRLAVDRDGALLIGTLNGLAILRAGRVETYGTGLGLASRSVSAVLGDRDGNVWVGTIAGLQRLEKSGRFSPVLFAGQTVQALLEDHEGSLWVATEQAGLHRLRDTKFALLGAAEGIATSIPFFVYPDAEDALWVGGYGHTLTRLAGGVATSWDAPATAGSDRLTVVGRNPAGGLLVATRNTLFAFDGGSFRPVEAAKSGLTDHPRCITSDSKGRVWVATSKGTVCFQGGRVTVYGPKDGLGRDQSRVVHEDRKGRIWVGTDGGLSLLSGAAFETYNPPGATLAVWALSEDEDGALWLGTSNAGLWRFDGRRFDRLSLEEGLADDLLYSVIDDGDGNLWMSSNNGIFHVSKREAKELFAGARRTVRCVTYGPADGLLSPECNGGGQPAGCRTKDGRLWFPTVSGVATIDPRHLRINRVPPPIVIEEVRVDDEPTVSHVVPPGARKLELHYTALSLVAPAAVRFRYKLEGFDHGWVEAGPRRTAYYTRLSPGDYRFVVTACNNDGVWNETGVAYALRLKPYFHQTGWFYGLLAALVACAAAGAYALRVRQLRTRFATVLEERTRVARELHDTLAQGLSGAVIEIENARALVKSDPDVSVEHLVAAREAARLSLAEARRSVWALRSEALASGSLLGALESFAKEKTSGAAIRVSTRRTGAERRLPVGVESNLLRIGQEAITNAVRHARPGTIEVSLGYEPTRVRLGVVDDGCGFDADAPVPQGHYGLAGLKERARVLGGEITIGSAPGRGTRIEVILEA